MIRLILIIPALMILLISCEEDKQEVRYSGIAVFSSEPGGEYFTSGYGFSFEKGKNIVCSTLLCKEADIVAVHLILQTEIESVMLQSPDNLEAFHLNGSFDTEAEAIGYFNDYTQVTTTEFEFDTGDLEPHQVWTFQSVSKKYAKFRIIEINLYSDATYPYAEVKVEYEYQPSGSRTFGRN